MKLIKTGLTLTQGAMIAVMLVAAPNAQAAATPKKNVHIQLMKEGQRYLKKDQRILVIQDNRVEASCNNCHHLWASERYGTIRVINKEGDVIGERAFKAPGKGREHIDIEVQ